MTSLISPLLPLAEKLLQVIGGVSYYEIWLPIVIILGVAFWIRRHAVLYYGEAAHSGWVVTIYILLSLYLLKRPALSILVGVVTLLVLYITEKILQSYGRKQRLFASFDVGVAIAILCCFHPLFIVLLPLFLVSMHRLELMHWKQFGAIMLGVFSIFWTLLLLYFILYGPLGTEAIVVAYGEMFSPPGDWLRYIDNFSLLIHDIGIATLVFVSIGYISYALPRALRRHRFTLRVHLSLMILMTLVYFIYYPSGNFLFLPILYMLLSIFTGHIMRKLNSWVWRVLLLLPYLPILYHLISLYLTY